MEGTIHLHARASDIEALYFEGGRFDPLRSEVTRKARLGVMAGCLLAMMLLVTATWLQGAAIILGVMAPVVLLAALINYARAAFRLLLERARIRKFARDVEANSPSQLALSEQGFRLVHAGVPYEVAWSSVTGGTHHPEALFLRADDTYLFPRSAMQPAEFDGLVELIRSKVPHLKCLPAGAGGSRPSQ
ncbi:MAG: YcxB family protein [Flavobacteriales bacterium]|nr:YcxB family protein [Flavobacteriales bacterium]